MHDSRPSSSILSLLRQNTVWTVLSRHYAAAFVVLLCCAIAAVGYVVVRDVHIADTEVQNMYARSVRGLRLIGELQYQAQETRRTSLYALTTTDSNLQVEYADQSRQADDYVAKGIADFLQHASTPLQLEIGERLNHDWSAYLAVRNEVMASILEGSIREAVRRDLQQGVPSFDRVRHDLEDIKRLYDEEASHRIAVVAASSRRGILRLIAVLCAIFLFATGSSYAVQRSHTQAALDFAKLQMDFVTSVSHELRTPLSVICSAADNIADGVIEDPDQIARYGAMIRNQTRQVTELVNEVLLFAKTKEGRTPYILRPISVSKIVDAVIQNTSELLREEGFDLRVDVEEALPDVMGDLSALTQCLQNLVVNAVKYSGHSRWIGVRAGLHEDGRVGIAEVRISVEDRGLGIAQSEISRIFEPFYRSPAACAAQIHGTGLGLPLARSIAEAMGGKLSVASELGCGSIFTLHLPVAIERVHAASA